MNFNTVKKLHSIALLLESLALLLVLLMTIGQKFVKTIIHAPSELRKIDVIPLELLVSVIPALVLFGISYFLIKKNNGINSTTHVISILTVTLVLRILTPYVNTLIVRIYASLRSVAYFSSYGSLVSAINYVVSPIQIVAFALFCLSLGGYYGMEKR